MPGTGARSVTHEEYEAAFRDLVTLPLRQVVGWTLLSVIYCVLNYDAEEPGLSAVGGNDFGSQGVSLRFDGEVVVELDRGFWGVFRDDTVASYLMARSEPSWTARAQPASVPRDPDGPVGLRMADATAVEPWLRHVGTLPVEVAVWGCALDDGRVSPQAAEFRFPGGSVVVASGYSADAEFVGEGDELLVFDERGWAGRRHETCTGRLLSVVWRSGGGAGQI